MALSMGEVIAGQGAVRMLYTVPNATFIEKPAGDSVVAINDVSGSISTLQTSINNARVANPNSVLVIRLLSNATYSVSSAGIVLGARECLVASGATIQAASSSVTVPLIQITSGSTNVSVAGGTLDGNGANIQGIYAPAAARVNVDRVTARNCGQDCILLKGNGNSVYDNEMTVTRCEVSGSAAHAGISIQNSTQTVVADNHCHDNFAGIYLSCAWAMVANNSCEHNTTGIDLAGGSDNVIANNTCDDNGTGIHAGASNNMIVSNATGDNSTAGINSNGSGNTFVDNFFASGNTSDFSSAGSGNRIVAYKTPLSASGQNYFYPPLISDQHTNTIVNGMGRTDLTIGSTTVAAVQSQYDSARTGNPNNVIVLHLNGTFTVGSSPLLLSSNTCVLLNGTIQINSSTTASSAISDTSSPSRVSISGGIIDGGNLTGNNAIQFSSSSMLQVDAMTLRNFGPSNPRTGGSDVIHFDHGSLPYIVTRCTINGGSARGIWLQLSGVKSVISDNDVSNVNQDGVDCDSSTSGSVVKFNYCHDLVRYGVFIEQSAANNVALGNICNNTGRDINLYNNYATYRSPVQHNTVAFNWCYGNNGIRNGSTGTNTTVTSHNFLFNNTVINASITSELQGTENYYSQNYLSGGSLTTSGSETFFNSSDVDGYFAIQDSNSGLDVIVTNASTGSGAAIVTGPASGSANDRWQLLPTTSGYYRVMNRNSGLALVVQGASTAAGALIVQSAYTGDSTYNDEWLVQPVGNGLYNFVNRRSGLYLDVTGASLTPGTQLTQQTASGGANQQFNLTGMILNGLLPFSLSASPPSQTILAGNSTSFAVTVSTGTNFSGSVALSLAGLPPNASGSFSPPSLTTNGVSTLNITTATNSALGAYTLTVTGTNTSGALATTVSLTLYSPSVANPGTLVWTAASGVDTNWSTPLNWTNLTSSGNGPPGISNDVKFFDPGAVMAASNINNIVNANLTVASLQFGNTNGNHTTLIGAGRTLSAGGLTVGTETDGTNTQSLLATFTGAGSLKLTNTGGNLIVRQGVATASGNPDLRATLDLSGLQSFNATLGKMQIGAQGANARPSGTLFLARENTISVSGSSPAIEVGGHGGGSGNAGNGSFVYLGQANDIFANGISIGNVKQGGSALLFNPAFSDPAATFRAADGVGPVPTWFIADSQSQSGTVNTTATNDFTGGTVDALVDTLTLARSSTGSGTGNPVGVLTFNAGTMTIGILQVAYQGSSGANFSAATVNVNDTATLAVTGNLELAHTIGGTGATNTTGNLNVNGGTVLANGIVNGGGIANLTLNGGTLFLTNSAGTAARRISSLNLTNAVLHFQLDANSIFTNILATNLNAGGLTGICIDSLANATGTNRFPLFKYSTFAGSVAGNLIVTATPAGFVGGLTNNLAGQTIDVIVTPVVPKPPTITSATYSAANATLTLAGTNGAPGLSYSILASTDIALPLTNWIPVGADVFDANGEFTYAIDINPNQPRRFYRIKSP